MYFITLLLIPLPTSASFCKINDITRVRQLSDYCGPAVMASIMNFYGLPLTQIEIGKSVFNKSLRATFGSELLYFSRANNFAAYSFTATKNTLKDILSDGYPIIVLQQNSETDKSGHFRIVTGFDDEKEIFYITDPYYDDIDNMTYKLFDALSKRMNNWALVILPENRDNYRGTFLATNAVCSLDMAEATLSRGEAQNAIAYAEQALAEEPNNTYAKSIIARAKKLKTY